MWARALVGKKGKKKDKAKEEIGRSRRVMKVNWRNYLSGQVNWQRRRMIKLGRWHSFVTINSLRFLEKPFTAGTNPHSRYKTDFSLYYITDRGKSRIIRSANCSHPLSGLAESCNMKLKVSCWFPRLSFKINKQTSLNFKKWISHHWNSSWQEIY